MSASFGLNIIRGWFKEKGKWMHYIYIGMALICCYMTLSQLSAQISKSVRILCYILCLISGMKIKNSVRGIAQIFDTPFKKILYIMLAIYGTFAVTGMYFISVNVSYMIQYPALLYFMLSFVWVYPIVQNEISLLVKTGEKIHVEQCGVRFGKRVILMGILMCPCILFLIAFNPAITSPDSEYCFMAAHQLWQPGFSMMDWHPPFYVFVLNILIKICDSVSFVIVLQCLCFAAVFVDGILFLYQCGVPKKPLFIFYCFISFGISNVIQLVTLWKDIPYMISIMWLTILLIKFVMRQHRYETDSGWHIQFVVAVVFTAFFRQNGILPAVLVIILFPIVTKLTKKKAVSCMLCVLLIACIKGPLYQSMNVTSQPQLKFFSLANDIMYSYYYGGTVSEEALGLINKITENDPEHYTQYNPFWVNYNPNEPKDYSVGEFLRIYFQNVWQNPKLAVKAVMTRNTDIWSIVRPYEEPQSCVNYLDEKRTLEVYPCRSSNILTHKLTVLCEALADNSLFYIFYWRTGIYNLIIIYMAVITWCIHKERRLFYILPFVPVLANLAALFISSGWTDYRYFWPGMTISLFLLFYFIMCIRTQGADNYDRGDGDADKHSGNN